MAAAMEIPEGVALLGTTFLAIIGAVWSLAWWLSGKFTFLINLIYKQKEDILSKLDYHEKHDDTRFDALQRDIFTIQLKAATSALDKKDL